LHYWQTEVHLAGRFRPTCQDRLGQLFAQAQMADPAERDKLLQVFHGIFISMYSIITKLVGGSTLFCYVYYVVN
jgi:hypothetical protein